MDWVSKLRSGAQIKDFYERNGNPAPYVLRSNKGNQLLVFIGVTHCNDPTDPQFEVIRQEWARFVETTQDGERITLTEGGIWSVENDETLAIERHGEPGLVAALADHAGIPAATPEPSESLEGDFLLQQFSPEAIMYYYFARQIPQWHQIVPRPDFRSYMQDALDYYQASLSWDFDFSVDNLIDIHAKLFSTAFDEHDKEFFENQSSIEQETVIHHVSQVSLDFRNHHIAQELLRYWDQGLSVFAVYGSDHAYVLEPLITELGSR